MHTLGKHVPIVPVICKSDCMTIAEQARSASCAFTLALVYFVFRELNTSCPLLQACFRQEVVSRLANPSLAGYPGMLLLTPFA